jgi:hypothetical protein
LAALVEGHDAGIGGHAAQESRIARQFVHEFDMGEQAGDHDDVDGPVAHHLIGDADVAALRVMRFRQDQLVHRPQSRMRP